MADALTAVYDRVRSDPERHLGRRSLKLLPAYELGYDLARERWGQQTFAASSAFDGEAFNTTWVEVRFGWPSDHHSKTGAAGFARLGSVDDHAAFDLFFDLRDSAAQELPPRQAGEASNDDCRLYEGRPLIEFLDHDRFRTRPGLWLGGPSADGAWALCNGYFWAERDLDVGETNDAKVIAGFQRWIGARYPFAAGHPWNRVLNFFALDVPERAWKSFFDLFDIYRAGDPPDAPSPTARVMLASITEHIQASSPGTNADEVADVYGPVVKQIAPT